VKVYIKFLTILFFKSLFYVIAVMTSLVIILNLLSELDFFKDIDVDTHYPLFLTLLNSPTMVFEMFPFIFLICTQLFFINLFNNREIDIFKYTGLKNSKILIIISVISIITGILITLLFYNFSSSLKNFYLELKSQHTTDGKYLAVITKNGLWIKDKIDNKILIINSSKIDQEYLIGNFVTEFDENFKVIRNIKSEKINIKNKEWIIFNAKIYKKNNYKFENQIKFKTNFDYEKMQSLYSNLSSLNIYQLFELRENYIRLSYSVTEVNLQILKLISLPIYLLLMTLFSASIMLRIKHIDNTTFKISIGLFCSVIIYYLNNFFHVLGSTERIPLLISVFIPIFMLILTNTIMLRKVNEK
jgi:lipopolysaccharide export system permease protein